MSFPAKRYVLRNLEDINNYVHDLEKRLAIFSFINGIVKIGQPGNYTEYPANGNAIRFGLARTLNANWVDAGGIKAPGAKPATLIAHGILETPAWRFANQILVANQETVSFNTKVPERQDRSAAPYFDIGWSTTQVDPGDNTVRAMWQLEYLWRSADEDTTAAAQATITVISSASTVAEGFVYSTFPVLQLPSETDFCCHCKITRLSANVADTITGPIELHGICYLFAANKYGRQT